MSESPPWRRWTIIAILFFLSPWASAGFPLLSGAALIAKGFKLDDTLVYLAIATLGPILGTAVAAFALDRVERRSALTTCVVSMSFALLVFAEGVTPIILLAASFAFNLMSTIYLTALNIHAVELFPSRFRGASAAGAWTFNRLGAALVPIALLPLLNTMGVLALCTLMSGTLLATAMLVLLGPTGMARRSLY